MKTLTTSKRFYDKWLYKVTIDFSDFEMSLSRFNKLHSKIKEYCQTGDYFWNFEFWQVESMDAHKTQILEFIDVMESYPKDSWYTRLEYYFTVFTNDIKLYDELSAKYVIVERSEPDLSNISLIEPNTISVKKLPFGRYQYKVYLKPHKIVDPVEKLEYIKWMKTQVPRITFSEPIRDWIMYTRWSGDARYILVEDEYTLLLIRMRNQAIIGRIYRHVVI